MKICHNWFLHTQINVIESISQNSKIVPSNRSINEKNKKDSESLGILLKYCQSKLKLTLANIKDDSNCTVPSPFSPVHLKIKCAYETCVSCPIPETYFELKVVPAFEGISIFCKALYIR